MDTFGVLTTLLRALRRRTLKGCPPSDSTKIIIWHAPHLQGATFTGLSQHQRKFSNVANEHHFLCLLGGDLQGDHLGDGRNRCLTARPTSVKFVLEGSRGQ